MKNYTILSQANLRGPGRPANSTTTKQAPEPIPPRPLEPLPPTVTVQVYEILREHGFSFEEARELATQSTAAYLSTTQRLFQFQGAVTIEISAGIARLVYAPRHHETPRRTVERIESAAQSELDRRTREIREKRERDERRRPW